ncbi:MAG: hypothetical protein DRR16_07890 [Candidatus Parabeggiatoa sp. nov. 3]|nr:MAG: hypothetical protein DRR16_07890 [Gammaproteobacteria bacterium]
MLAIQVVLLQHRLDDYDTIYPVLPENDRQTENNYQDTKHSSLPTNPYQKTRAGLFLFLGKNLD